MHAGQDIQTAMQRVMVAMSDADLAAAKAACQQMSDANQRLSATLPSPVLALTSEVQGVVDEISSATRVCLAAGPGAGQQNIGLFKLHMSAAMAHATRAQQIALGG
jgi:hypothetical protein